MKKNIFVFIIAAACLLAGGPVLQAQEAEPGIFSLHFIPGITLPLGRDVESFTLGGGASLIARLAIPGISFLYIEAGAGFSVTPLSLVEDSGFDSVMMYLISPRAGVGAQFPIFSGFTAGVHAHGGYYFASLDADVENNTGSNALIDVGAEVNYQLTSNLSLGLGASYRNFFGLYNDIMINLGVSYSFSGGPAATILNPKMKKYDELEINELKLNEIFPVFFKYYDDHPIGTLKIRNNGSVPLENVNVKIFVGQYMDNPNVCKHFNSIGAGKEESVDLYALFNEKVLGISESTKVQVNVSVESTVAGEQYGNEKVETLRLYDRNAITWEDDKRAAAFVTTKDPVVLKFSKNVKSYIENKAGGALNKNLLTGLAYFETLRLYGIRYVKDPSSPYEELSQKKNSVDYLQFPNQTLEYKAGDCDDLSILYAALLESVGIKSAFITTPGHIYVAFSLDMTPQEARRSFQDYNDLIFQDNNAWLPVEITMLGKDFLEAWYVGIKQWNEHSPGGRAGFIPIENAWKTYEPVGFTSESFSLVLPEREKIEKAFLAQVEKYTNRDLLPRVEELKRKIAANPANNKLQNQLGVLYASYGVYDKAEEAFKAILSKEDYLPALINMGNIAFLNNEYASAKSYYEKAYNREPKNKTVLLNLAKVNYELGRYNQVDTYYSALKKQDAELAKRFSYLDLKGGEESTRASGAQTMKEEMLWEE
jgi:transglutaminase-like putative cysteine protease